MGTDFLRTLSKAFLLLAVVLNAVALFFPQWARSEVEGGDLYVINQRFVMTQGYFIQPMTVPAVVALVVLVDLVFSLIKSKTGNSAWETITGVFAVICSVGVLVVWYIFHFPPWVISDPQAGESQRLQWSMGFGMVISFISGVLMLAHGVISIINSCIDKKSEDYGRLDKDDGHTVGSFNAILLVLTLALSSAFIIWWLSWSFAGCRISDANQLILPEGFTAEIYVSGIKAPREMAYSNSTGNLYVGSFGTFNEKSYSVYCVDAERNVKVIYEDTNIPSGVTLSASGDLYVGVINKILRFPKIDEQVAAGGKITFDIVTDQLPDKIHHGWKYLRFGPDGLLYVPISAPCNICEKINDFFQIATFNITEDGSLNPYNSSSGGEMFVTGVRNSVGFDFHPVTQEFWFTDNGRDWMGDNLPHDELNRAPTRGLDYGFPYCFDDGVPDPDFNDDHDCTPFVEPSQLLTPHAAAIGMTFYTGEQFPEKYHNSIFIAEHGSWNSHHVRGYTVTAAILDEAGVNVVSYEPFVTGFIDEAKNLGCGRPADVLVLPDGSILISDDFSNQIYQIRYTNSTK
eukprot:TRINITY_DN9288_c0_g1_i1.p1 TRINITY_DN9288_c0_g1~~TRINITY_DN9288_c0_g1_i1.p1  ORF type:complete len:571 (+),score=118.72 TRINITY_DN9288_c0_g1_i1:59-1771(+)